MAFSEKSKGFSKDKTDLFSLLQLEMQRGFCLGKNTGGSDIELCAVSDFRSEVSDAEECRIRSKNW